MRLIAFAVMLFATSTGFCQTPAKEPDTLQALLTEVHQLRQAIESVTAASQRVQIALYALQMQDAAVVRTIARLDETRKKCAALETDRQRTASALQRMESLLTSGTVAEQELKEVRFRLPEMKSGLDARTSEAQACQASEAEAATQLRNDQAKLTDLQDRIERLDKTLEQLNKLPTTH